MKGGNREIAEAVGQDSLGKLAEDVKLLIEQRKETIRQINTVFNIGINGVEDRIQKNMQGKNIVLPDDKKGVVKSVIMLESGFISIKLTDGSSWVGSMNDIKKIIVEEVVN